MNIITADALKCLPEMPDKSVDVVLTSPPYNRKRNDKYAEYDDDIEDYYGFLKTTIDELLRVCRKWIFFNIQATYYNRADVYRLIGEYADHHSLRRYASTEQFHIYYEFDIVFTHPNDLVLDCFFGTGTTGVACKTYGRDFIGIEINEKYSEYAKKRLDGVLEITSNEHQMTFDDILAE